MATLGRLEFRVPDTAGNALSGVSVEIRRQGAQVSGAQAASPYTVDHVNGIVATDVVALNTGSTTRTVSSITATTVTTSGGDLGAVVDDDRITISSALPTLYEDAEAATTKSNPLTTDSTGRAWCYVTGGLYDVKVSGGGATTALHVDQLAQGGTSTIINLYPSGTSVGYITDTLRDLAAADTHTALRSAGANIFRVMGDGEIIAGEAGATHALTGNTTVTGTLTSSGALTVQAGGAAVTGAITGTTTIAATTTVTGGTGVTATTGNLQATAGDLVVRRVRPVQGTALVIGDFVLSAGWGATATRVIANESTDTAGMVTVTTGGAGQAANPTITFTYKDGAYSTIPMMVIQRVTNGALTDQLTVQFTVSTGLSSATLTFRGTPAGTESYGFSWIMVQ